MSPLITVESLYSRLGEPGLKIVDASWYMPAEKRDTGAEHLAAHIPGAVFFDIDANSDTTSPFPHMLAGESEFQNIARGLGIDDGDEIIVYDTSGLFSAARVWWNFRVMGAENVRVLDGGLPAWRAAGLPLASGIEPQRQGNFTPRFNSHLVLSFEKMLETVQTRQAQVIDARGAQRFRGEAAEPRPGVQSGHIPGSYNLHYARLVEPNGTLKPVAALREEFSRLGLGLSEPIVTSCGSGVTASILALGLAVLGREDVAVYDGSWSEWGARPESAHLIEKGPGTGEA